MVRVSRSATIAQRLLQPEKEGESVSRAEGVRVEIAELREETRRGFDETRRALATVQEGMAGIVEILGRMERVEDAG